MKKIINFLGRIISSLTIIVLLSWAKIDYHLSAIVNDDDGWEIKKAFYDSLSYAEPEEYIKKKDEQKITNVKLTIIVTIMFCIVGTIIFLTKRFS